MPAGQRPVSKPVTIAVLALVAVGGVMFVREIFMQKPAAEAAPAPLQVTSR